MFGLFILFISTFPSSASFVHTSKEGRFNNLFPSWEKTTTAECGRKWRKQGSPTLSFLIYFFLFKRLNLGHVEHKMCPPFSWSEKTFPRIFKAFHVQARLSFVLCYILIVFWPSPRRRWTGNFCHFYMRNTHYKSNDRKNTCTECFRTIIVHLYDNAWYLIH
jgi:hypothetical protein